jgi:hypothetical protein
LLGWLIYAPGNRYTPNWLPDITRTKEDKMEIGNGRVFDTRYEAAEDNAPGKPPVKLGTTPHQG